MLQLVIVLTSPFVLNIDCISLVSVLQSRVVTKYALRRLTALYDELGL
jgi:hypothetical protein